MVVDKLRNAGYGAALVSVTPPDAEVHPRSNLSPKSLGKAPGLWTPEGWVGYSFTTEEVQDFHPDANIGILARDYPGLDIDVEHPILARLVQQEAEKHFGPAPVRTSREPRKLLVYRTDEPFARIACKIRYQGEEHMVEVLGDGRQFVLAGQHPSGVEYGWDGEPLWKFRPQDLSVISKTATLDFFAHLKAKLEGRATVEIQGTGETKEALAPPQEDLKAPSLEALEAAVSNIANDEAFSDRDTYILMGHAIKAAGGSEARHIFLEWAGRWEDGHNDPETVAADWSRMQPPYRVGWSWIAELAGVQTAVEEFSVNPDATPPEEPPKRASIFANKQRHGEVVKEPINFLVDNFIWDSGINMLGADPASYKTTLALHVAVGVATGADVLGHEVRRTGPVLFVSQEDNASLLQSHAQAMMEGSGVEGQPDIWYLALEGFSISSREHMEDVRREIELVRPRLIILDPISYMFEGDENSNTDWNLPLNAMATWLPEDGPAILLVHHAGKGSMGKSDKDRMFRGARKLFDRARTAWGLTKRERTNSFQLKCLKMSHAKPLDPVTVFVDVDTDEKGVDWQTCSFKVVASHVVEAEELLDEARREGITFLRDNPGATTTELTDGFTGSKEQRLAKRNVLERQGLIRSEPGEGRAVLWFLVEAGDEFSTEALIGEQHG